MYDPTHLFKSFRNNLLDHIITLPRGHKVSVKDFRQLKNIVDHEASVGFKLTDEVLDVKGSDRMDMRAALHMISDLNAALFRRFFPNDHAKLELADLLDTMSTAYKIFASRRKFDSKDKFRSGYGIFLEGK